GPELVPGVEVLKVLSTVGHPAVLELEDDAVGNVQVLAVSVRGAALDADHARVTVCSQVLQLGPEGASRLLCQLAEVRQRCVAALVVVGHRAPPRQVPDSSLVEELGERVDIARVERLVSAPHRGDVLGCSHDLSLQLEPAGVSPGRWSRVAHRRTAESTRHVAPATMTHTTPRAERASIRGRKRRSRDADAPLRAECSFGLFPALSVSGRLGWQLTPA